MIAYSRLRDWSLLLVCNLIWGSQFVMVKILQRQLGPVFATFFPMTLATLFQIPILVRQRQPENPQNASGLLPAHDIAARAPFGVRTIAPRQKASVNAAHRTVSVSKQVEVQARGSV